MKKRKVVTVLCILCLLFSLIACKKQEAQEGITDKVEVVPDISNEIQPDKTVTQTKLVTYEGPSLMTSSEKVKVTVNGSDLFVYETLVNHDRIFSYTAPETMNQVVIFDFEGKITMEVEVPEGTSLSEVTVRPKAYEIEPIVDGNKITFELSYPANYTLEYNDGTSEDPADNALHIFANELEENPISADNVPADTLYIGPGIYKADAIPVQSNMTVYLAGGAYVYGQIRADQVENLTIRGRGIVSGSIYERTKASEKAIPIEIRNSKNLKIEGITILDPAGWTVALYKCTDVTIDNLKLISARANGDGISVQSCSNVTMKGGFVRTWDDSLVVKNEDRGNTSNILFDQVVVWTDLAQSCEVGYETNGETMDGITFQNITILHNYHKAALSMHNSDDAKISNVTYRNITIEDGRMLGDNRNDGDNDYLIDMTVAYSPEWSVSGGIRGSVEHITFSNIKVLSLEDTVVSRMLGESKESNIHDVTVNNIEIEGQMIKSESDLSLAMNDFVSNVSVSENGNTTGAVIAYPYVLALDGSETEQINVATKEQGGLEVPEFSILNAKESYMGVKIPMKEAVTTATHGIGTTLKATYDDGSGSMASAEGPIVNLFDGDRKTAFISKAWSSKEEEFIALTADFKKVVRPGVVRVYLAEDSPFVREYRVAVFVKKDEAAENFSRALSSTSFISSPATGNYFDIKLSSTLECSQLQLRFFRTDGMLAPGELVIQEIASYPSSLSTNMPIYDSSEYNDVYTADYLTDGNEGTYWEAKDVNAYFAVDMGAEHDIYFINLHLPPLLTWEPRTQTIEMLSSMDGKMFTTAVGATEYLFDPVTGNINSIEFEEPLRARYIKLQWSSNSSLGGYGAQLSEIYIYGE